MSIKLRFCATLLALCLWLAPSCMADSMHDPLDNPSFDVQITVGYDGVMTYGRVMPVRVRVENQGADFSGLAAINVYMSRAEYNRYEMELDLPSGTVKELLFPVAVYSRQRTFTVELIQDGNKVCAVNAVPDTVISPNVSMIGVLSDRARLLSNMSVDMENDELIRGEYWKTVPLTPETFPDSPAMLDSFSMLVVDNVDVNTLSVSQRQALEKWLNNGHILFLSGGAEADLVFPAFEKTTGVRAGRLVTDVDVTPALSKAVGISRTPLGKGVAITEASGEGAIAAEGDHPLVFKTVVGAGRIYTFAFSLADQSLGQWQPFGSWWQRLLLETDPTLYDTCRYANESSVNFIDGSGLVPFSENSNLLFASIAAILSLVIGWGLYAILRKKDRRHLLWALLPACSVLAGIVILLLGAFSPVSKAGLVSIAQVTQDASGVISATTSLSLAAPEKGAHEISVLRGTIKPYSYDYYDYYTEDQPSEPVTLRYRMINGQRSALSLTQAQPWTVSRAYVQDSLDIAGRVEARLWMEEDGLHGTMKNELGFDLSEGVVMTRLGFASVPALGNGEEYVFSMRRATVKDPKKPVYLDGYMYESIAGTGTDMYDLIDEYVYHTSQLKKPTDRVMSPENAIKGTLISSCISDRYIYTSSYVGLDPEAFYYIAFHDELGEVEAWLDGEPLTRKEARGVVCVKIPFLSVGPTGVVYFAPGQVLAQRILLTDTYLPKLDAQGRAVVDEVDSMTAWYELSERPSFVFQLPDVAGFSAESMTILLESYGVKTKLYLYDPQTMEWQEGPINEAIANPGRYLNGQGQLIIQLRSDQNGVNYEARTPQLLLEGRTDHAEY